MKKLFSILLLAVLLLPLIPAGASAELEEKACLNAAFSMIEPDNIFLRRYNEITGANVQAAFPLGMPYFFGGQDGEEITAEAPHYKKRKMWESTKFYKKDKVYVYGFDCSGFTKWICRQSGMNEFGDKGHPGLQDMIMLDVYKQNNQLFGGGTRAVKLKEKAMPPYAELKDHLQIGDLLVAKHSARHVMMYIGTMRDYGFTAEEVPELADYLDYPLVIHCGPNPFYGERFQKFIDENDEYKSCLTTNGGVMVSIIGVPAKAAPYHVEKFQNVKNNNFDYFKIDNGNYIMTIWDLPGATSFCWFRVHSV